MGIAHRIGQFTPLHNPNLVWYHKVGKGMTLVGSVASAMADLSGNAHHFTETSARPTYAESVQNGRPGLLFSSSRMKFATGVSQTSLATYVVVLKPTASSSYQVVLDRTTAYEPEFYRIGSDQATYITSVNEFHGDTITQGACSVVVWRYNYATKQVWMSVNGAAYKTFTSTTFVLGTWTAIGSYYGSISQTFTGYWFADAMYSSLLTTSQERQLVQQWAHEYAVTLAA